MALNEGSGRGMAWEIPVRMRLMLKATFFLSLAVAVALIGGCAGNGLSPIDDQISKLINEQWKRSTQVSSEDQPSLGTQLSLQVTEESSNLHQTRLMTNNPPASDLPAQKQNLSSDHASTLSHDADQNPVTLDLNGLLTYAIEHGREYRRQKETLFITAINLLIERHLWGPRFFNTLNTTFSGTPEQGDYDQAITVINNFRVTQRLPYGGNVSATALVNFVNLLHDTTGNEGQSASAKLEATLPLLRGSGLVAQENLIQANRDLIYAARTFERFRRQFLLDIATRYYDLVQQQEAIKNRQRQLDSFLWLNDRITALAQAGRQPHFEIQRAEQQVLFARNNLINSQENYESQLDTLKLLIGMAVAEPLAVKPMELALVQPHLDTDQAIKIALGLRLDLQTNANKVDDARRKVRNARQALRGELDMTGSITFNTNTLKKNAGVDLQLRDSDFSVGLAYDAPLDRRIEQLALRKEIISLERVYRTYTQTRDRIALETRRAIRRIQQARFTLDLQIRNIDVATKRMRGVVLRLRTLGPRDFIEAQNDLLEAQNRRDAAVRDLRVSILQYLQGTGQLRVDATGKWQAPVQLTEPVDKKEVPVGGQWLHPDRPENEKSNAEKP